MMEVVQTKDSSSLYYPALILNGASCILWVFYGLLGVRDIAIYLPSLVGLFLVIIGLGMCFIYPAMYIHVDEGQTGETKEVGEAITIRDISPYAVYGTGREMSFASLPGGSVKVYMDRSNKDISCTRNTRKGSFFRDRSNRSVSGASDSDLYSAPNFLNKLRSDKRKLLLHTQSCSNRIKEGKEEFDSRFDCILEDYDSTRKFDITDDKKSQKKNGI
jgi:hypothetical protein